MHDVIMMVNSQRYIELDLQGLSSLVCTYTIALTLFDCACLGSLSVPYNIDCTVHNV
jgi:hypothetical protein